MLIQHCDKCHRAIDDNQTSHSERLVVELELVKHSHIVCDDCHYEVAVRDKYDMLFDEWFNKSKGPTTYHSSLMLFRSRPQNYGILLKKVGPWYSFRIDREKDVWVLQKFNGETGDEMFRHHGQGPDEYKLAKKAAERV